MKCESCRIHDVCAVWGVMVSDDSMAVLTVSLGMLAGCAAGFFRLPHTLRFAVKSIS